jgi:LysR family cys regulon transcriptional activator
MYQGLGMNLQQMRYLCAVIDNKFNISDAANALFTSQPGISKQIRLLEEELGVKIFLRYGKRITELTEPGKAVFSIARRILQEAENLKRVGAEYSDEDSGTFTLATTHTQARYVLPKVIQQFSLKYPKVKLLLHQGNPTQVADQVVSGEADLGIATEALAANTDLITLPCYQWNRCVIVPLGHPLTKQKALTLEAIARYPIITYDFSFTGRSQINVAFGQKGLQPNVVLSALDSDVIKTYVELGLGIGILARMAYDPNRDKQFAMLDASHLFAASTTRIGIRRGTYLRRYVQDFITLFAPHLDRHTIDIALHGDGEQYEL